MPLLGVVEPGEEAGHRLQGALVAVAKPLNRRRVAHAEAENESARMGRLECRDPLGERRRLPGPDARDPGRHHEPARLGKGLFEHVEGLCVRVAASHPERAVSEALHSGGEATGISLEGSGADPYPHPAKGLPPTGCTRSRAAHRSPPSRARPAPFLSRGREATTTPAASVARRPGQFPRAARTFGTRDMVGRWRRGPGRRSTPVRKPATVQHHRIVRQLTLPFKRWSPANIWIETTGRY